MAIPGFGKRLVNDLLMEVSLHLAEPILLTALTAPVTSIGNFTVSVGSLGQPEIAVYPGALIVVDVGALAEIVSVISYDPVALTITANFANLHSTGAPVSGATFPTQAGTDPIFTQSEMTGYVSRAQNEFLEQVPVAFQIFYQNTITNQLLQTLPATAIELDHVSLSQMANPIYSLVRSGGTVTATFMFPHGLVAGQRFWVVQPVDLSYQGVFAVATVVSSTVITYLQPTAPDGYTGGGTGCYFYRLYERTQESLTLNDRYWRSTFQTPNAYYEDRTGNYQWGLGNLPRVGFPLELITSVRDSDSLTLLDGFLISDMLLHYVKYLVLSYCFGKDGVYRDPEREQYCQQRYKRGVAAVQRFLDGMTVDAQGVG